MFVIFTGYQCNQIENGFKIYELIKILKKKNILLRTVLQGSAISFIRDYSGPGGKTDSRLTNIVICGDICINDSTSP